MVLDKYLVSVRCHKNSLAEKDVAHLVDNLRGRIGIEVNYILMTSGFVDITVAVDAQIESFAAYHKTLVQRGQEDEVTASEPVDRNSQKSMVAPGIASHYGSVAIGSCLVRYDNLPLERIFQVYQF